MSDIMKIGISALMAFQTALKVTGQNIANAGTDFYSRREITFSENPYYSGVNSTSIQRIFDETLNRSVQTSTSTHAYWETYNAKMGSFEPLLDNNETSIGRFITDSLNALQQISNNFTTGDRSLYMNSLSALSSQFQNVNGEINKQLLDINQSLSTQEQQVNNILMSLSNINDLVVTTDSEVNPELLDQREALVQELSKYFDFQVTTDQRNRLDVSLSNGMSLLKSNPPYQFTMLTDPVNTNNLLIGVTNGNITMDVDRLLSGGQMAGLIRYRQNGLEAAQRSLGRLALVFSQTLNKQNGLGVDANGTLGGDIFADINSTTMMTNRVVANADNSGSSVMSVSVDDVSALTTSDYQLTIGAANSYTLTRKSDNQVVGSGTLAAMPVDISVDGFTLTVASGTFTSGDRYTISPTHGASDNMALTITDPSQLALGWPVNAANGIKSPGSNGLIKVTSIDDTTNSAFGTPGQLDPPVEIRFSVSGGVTTYTIYNATTSTAIAGPFNYVDGATAIPAGAFDPGYTITISGNRIQDGDTFDITYNSNPGSDNRNAQAMVEKYSEKTVLGANGQLITFNQGYIMLASDISTKTNEAQKRMTTSLGVKEQAQARRDELSGVSLEQESLNLSDYQVAYQASAQVLQMARNILDIIASLARG